MNLTDNNNHNIREELIIELRAYVNLIKKDINQKDEVKLALDCILQILKL